MNSKNKTNETCGCCKGITALTPVSLENLQGLHALSYRVGTHDSFKTTMMAALSGQKALGGLAIRDDDDPSLALIDAWACVLDVLTFYQERIANEGYLPTAAERSSVLELARVIGYELKPGVAASTFLAFTLDTAPGTPGYATIDTGAKVMSIPGQDEKPQTFETIEKIEARAAWNELKPRLTEPKIPVMGSTEVYLKGTATGLNPGDGLLFVGKEREQDPGSERWDFRIVKTVSDDKTAGYTQVTWDEGLGWQRFNRKVLPADKETKIYAFRQHASIFGFNAPDWRILPDAMKANYLGLNDPGDLTEEDKKEWPSFLIFAPEYPLKKIEQVPSFRTVPATPEAVGAAANAAAEGVAKAAMRDSAFAGINTVVSMAGIAKTAVDMTVNSAQALEGVVTTAVEAVTTSAQRDIQTRIQGLKSLINDAEIAAAQQAMFEIYAMIVAAQRDINKIAKDLSPLAAAKKILDFILNGVDKVEQDLQRILGTIPNEVDEKLAEVRSVIETKKSELDIANALTTPRPDQVARWIWDNILFVTNIKAAKNALQEVLNNLPSSDNASADISGLVRNIINAIITSFNTINPENTAFINYIKNNVETISIPLEQDFYNLAKDAVGTAVTVNAEIIKFFEAFINSATVQLAQTHLAIQHASDIARSTAIDAAEAVNPVEKLNELGDAVTKSRDAALAAAKALSGAAAAAGTSAAVAVAIKGAFLLPQKPSAESMYDIACGVAEAGVIAAPVLARAAVIAAITGVAVGPLVAVVLAGPEYGLILAPPVMAALIGAGIFAGGSIVVTGVEDTLNEGQIKKILKGDFSVLGNNVQIMNNPVSQFTEEYVVKGAIDGATKVKEEVCKAAKGAKEPTKIALPTRGPQIELTKDSIDLDTTYKQIASESWAVLSLLNNREVYKVKTVSEASRAEYSLTGKTTRLKLEGENLNTFEKDVRPLVVYAQSEQLEIAEAPRTDMLSGNIIELGSIVPGLAKGKLLIISGKRMRALVTQAGLELVSFDGERRKTVRPGEVLQVLEPHFESGNNTTWTLMDRNGFKGSVTDLQDSIQQMPATPEDTVVSEVAELDGVFEKATPKKLKVVEIAFGDNISAAKKAGLGKTSPGEAFENGCYRIVGWNGESYVALNGKVGKIVRLVLEQDAAGKETINEGGVWEIGGGWRLAVKNITKTKVKLELLKDGIVKEQKDVAKGGIYTYIENNIAAETDVPLFVTYVEPVSPAGTIQFGYTWAAGTDITEVKVGDEFGMPAGSSDTGTVLVLGQRMQNSYDPATVSIYANIARATHGETVRELLGSGSGAKANQRFMLKKQHLTFISAKTPGGTESTTEVRVNDVKWQEVPSLYGLDARIQGYIIRIDDDSNATLTFGDGKNGARLPSGQENVAVSYRIGIGMQGMVKANQLSLLMTRPLGVKGVINPLAPTGAADPETRDQAKQNAPHKVLTLDRIVSLQDFEDFARAFAGIGKARAAWLRDGEVHFVHITVASAGGGTVDKMSDIYKNLWQGIEGARDPVQEFRMDSFKLLSFSLSASVLVDSRYIKEKILAAVTDALIKAFSFEQRSFAQGVTQSEVLAVMQNVEGIIAVDLNALYLKGDMPALQDYLGAGNARLDNGTLTLAELLILNPGGIELTEMRL